MAASADWLGITEDQLGPWYVSIGWPLLGMLAAIAAGLLARCAANWLFRVEPPAF